ncbi:hypothetical protein M0L20_17540 [Spirosoma sp. RP8]|uniref:Uncharacterized protein n=1 Tax=Spirosoma liriopis TaxID=2937440 RepID=A0ABT0HNC5_9BACT|nr:hypothetical protein [Spirosoma liriopis]MCK8493674.1 hypothetical protein [Spirosoma liriopis]
MSQSPQFLRAGSVQVRYENGFLRYLTTDDAEIVRMIYFAIRDHNWSTATLTISDEEIHQTGDSFQVAYTWQTDDLGIQMTGHIRIQGDADGTIAFDFIGKALNTFQKNRIGICVLHPIDGILGQPAQVAAPDGTITDGYFPTFISPHQPFLNIQTLRWKPTSGSSWQLDFSGDVFETEDQRNWTDASFKTYSTPLTIPFPATVSTDDEFWQRVVFRKAVSELTAPIAEKEVRAINPAVIRMEPTQPRIGVGQWAGGPPLTDDEARLLRQLDLSHLRADVFFSLPNWQTLLTAAIADARRLAVPLELAVFFGEDPTDELDRLQNFLGNQLSLVSFLLLFNEATLTTSDELLHTLVPAIRAQWPGVTIGGGTDDNFAEFNRNPFDVELVDFVTYSVNPQAHAGDDLTLWENIAGQTETVLTAKKLARGKPVHISPVTLRPRYTTVTNTATERLNTPADLRQTNEFGADWTHQSLDALANAGVESVTYYQSHGPAGLVTGTTAYPLLSVFEEYRKVGRED